MAETSQASQQFISLLPRFPLVVCQYCQVAVRPKQITYHLTHDPHRLSLRHAQEIAATIGTWEGILYDPTTLQYPPSVQDPIEALSIYTDGILCTVATDCQELEISSIDPGKVEQRYTEALSTVEYTVEAGQGILVPPLLQSLETPAPKGVENEAVVRVIWDIMGSVAAVSQRITKQCGHLARTKAARTEQHESPFTPLLAYMDEANIQRHVEPWQRILVFFARTLVRGESSGDWPGPKHRRRYHQAIHQLQLIPTHS
ncbi:hypothetical protein PENCOP_c045G01210, partial [Penicillium coprophilum]